MTRKQELSVLQSIGMTKRQLNNMVQYEAGMIAVWNIIITLLAGGFLGVIPVSYTHLHCLYNICSPDFLLFLIYTSYCLQL